MHWVLGTLSPRVKHLECEAKCSPSFSAEVKNMCVCVCVELFLDSQMHLHGVMFMHSDIIQFY
jgi:hypothetical protein